MEGMNGKEIGAEKKIRHERCSRRGIGSYGSLVLNGKSEKKAYQWRVLKNLILLSKMLV